MKVKLILFLCLPLIVALLCMGCDSIDEAQKRNKAELPTNPHATEPTPHVAPSPQYGADATFEAKEGETK